MTATDDAGPEPRFRAGARAHRNRSGPEPVIVVAVLTPRPGRLQDLIDALTEVAPDVHREPGCELYAVHSDGEVCVMVERWSSRAELDAHANGAVMERLTTLWADSLQPPFQSWIARNVPAGDHRIGTIQ